MLLADCYVTVVLTSTENETLVPINLPASIMILNETKSNPFLSPVLDIFLKCI
jgi:hypothetical protein